MPIRLSAFLVTLLSFSLTHAHGLSDERVEHELKESIKSYNLPKSVGNGVAWVSAKVLEREMVWNYVIDKTLAELDEHHSPEDFTRIMLGVIKPLYCNSDDMKLFRDNKVALVTDYLSKDGHLYDKIRFTWKSCEV